MKLAFTVWFYLLNAIETLILMVDSLLKTTVPSPLTTIRSQSIQSKKIFSIDDIFRMVDQNIRKPSAITDICSVVYT